MAFPTETVYGLGANALDSTAVSRIFIAKGRPATSPLIVHADSVATIRTVVSEWPGVAATLAERYWPGPLTLVLPQNGFVSQQVSAGLSTVGVRVPAHAVALALLQASAVPIAAPSANLFMQVSPTTAQHVWESMGDRVDLILDGGQTQVGIESTVLSLVDPGRPVLLRPGSIHREELEAFAGPIASATALEGGAHLSPGMHPRHYSPRTPLWIGSELTTGRCGYVWWARPQPAATSALQLPASPDGFASGLYAALHELDRLQLDAIVVEPVPDGVDWDGVRDRLERAAYRS